MKRDPDRQPRHEAVNAIHRGPNLAEDDEGEDEGGDEQPEDRLILRDRAGTSA